MWKKDQGVVNQKLNLFIKILYDMLAQTTVNITTYGSVILTWSPFTKISTFKSEGEVSWYIKLKGIRWPVPTHCLVCHRRRKRPATISLATKSTSFMCKTWKKDEIKNKNDIKLSVNKNPKLCHMIKNTFKSEF